MSECARPISETVWWCSNLPEREDGQQTIEGLAALERAAQPLPEWAVSIAEDQIAYFPPCGHDLFDRDVTAILEAIEQHRKVEGFCYCFKASDSALAKAREVIEQCAVEKQPSGYKEILAKRLEWWIAVSEMVRDNPFTVDTDHGDYYNWDEETERAIAESGLAADDPLLMKIKSTWLCAPKAFRFMERIGDEMGQDLAGYDAYDNDAFRAVVVDSIDKVEARAASSLERGNAVEAFLYALFSAKLTEYRDNGFLSKVFRTERKE